MKTIKQLKAIVKQWSEIKCYWRETATQTLRDSKHLSCEDVYDDIASEAMAYSVKELKCLIKLNDNDQNAIYPPLKEELEWKIKADALIARELKKQKKGKHGEK